jgi:phosphonatase-like hydrolase
MISLVVLDMAGTTVDEGGAVYDALHHAVAADELNANIDIDADAIQRWMGVEKRMAMRELTGAASGNEPDDESIERMYHRFATALRSAYAAEPPTPFPGVEDAFSSLRANGIQVALTTGFARDIADPLLETLGWSVGVDATIDVVVCGDEVTQGRPAPYLIFRAMELTAVQSVEHVLVAGDTIVDLQAGTNAGARCVVGVATGKLGHRELGRERHTHLLDSVAQLPPLLQSL